MKLSILRTITLAGVIFFPCSLLAQQNGQANDLPPAEAAMASSSIQKSGDQDSALLGAKLRTEIDKLYEKTLNNGGLKNEIDLSSIVTRYIPIGTSFDDAEKILRGAGFKVGARPKPNNSNSPIIDRPDRYDVTGEIDPYVQNFLSKVSVYVFLSPYKPYSYDKVEKVQGSITSSYP